MSAALSSQAPNARRFIALWSTLYPPKAVYLPSSERQQLEREVFKVSLRGRRRLTATKLAPDLKEQCRTAAIRLQDLYLSSENIGFADIITLANLSADIFSAVLQVYQSAPAVVITAADGRPMQTDLDLSTASGAPDLMQLAAAIDPLLERFYQQSSRGNTWKLTGFITTQLHLAYQCLQESLSEAEALLIEPYFRFAEDHVMMPWLSLCQAANGHEPMASTLCLAERLIPQMPHIAELSHRRWCQTFTDYSSERGTLLSPFIQRACLRDLRMIQVYLWRCFLENSFQIVEEELVLNCIVMNAKLAISWPMTVTGIRLLVEETLHQLTALEKELFYPHAVKMIEAFPIDTVSPSAPSKTVYQG